MDLIECSFAVAGLALMCVESVVLFKSKGDNKVLVFLHSALMASPVIWGLFFCMKTGRVSDFFMSAGLTCFIVSCIWLATATTYISYKVAKKLIPGNQQKRSFAPATTPATAMV